MNIRWRAGPGPSAGYSFAGSVAAASSMAPRMALRTATSTMLVPLRPACSPWITLKTSTETFDWLTALGMGNVAAAEHAIVNHALERLDEVPGLRFIGEPVTRAGVISFELDGIHPHDIGTILDMEGVAIRTGHHCAQPVMDRFGIPATARASFGVYNNEADVDALVRALVRVQKMMS